MTDRLDIAGLAQELIQSWAHRGLLGLRKMPDGRQAVWLAAQPVEEILTRLQQAEKERDALKHTVSMNRTDFDDCNQERARWSKRAKSAESRIAELEAALELLLETFIDTWAYDMTPHGTADEQVAVKDARKALKEKPDAD